MGSGELREPVICVRYSRDRGARFQVVRRREGLYEVWAQTRQTDETYCPGEVWYADVRDGAHFADTPEAAVLLGDEILKNLAGGPEE